jgi:hypothetical protein
MTASGVDTLPTIGFLTVREYEDLGLIGGYLILNVAGRPREFHCTAPVRPNRAQAILYGPTLQPFLYGEQIGHSLVARGSEQPFFICTDCPAVLALRPLIAQPVVLIGEPPLPAAGRDDGQRGGSPAGAGLHGFALAGLEVAVSAQTAEDAPRVQQWWEPYADQLDLREPFTRLRDAIDETQRGASRTSHAA